MLKNETPGLDPSSNSSPRHSMGEERSPPTCVSLSLYLRCFSESPRGPDLELCDLTNPGNEDLLQVFPGVPVQCPASSSVGLTEDGAGRRSQEASLHRSPQDEHPFCTHGSHLAIPPVAQNLPTAHIWEGDYGSIHRLSQATPWVYSLPLPLQEGAIRVEGWTLSCSCGLSGGRRQ